MNILEILLGQIPEAVYFSLFLIFTKEIKEKRILFTSLMIIEYLLLLHVFPYSVWSHVLYFIITFIIMKILYKNKSNVTDVFTLSIASIILIPISIVSFILSNKIIVLSSVISMIFKFTIIILFRHKLSKITDIYRRFWNKDDKPKKMKSTTFRALNLVLFNISIIIINTGMVIAIIYNNL